MSELLCHFQAEDVGKLNSNSQGTQYIKSSSLAKEY